jgi:hypothetical protein
MAKKTRATFQKREKERARQQRQHDKAQRASTALDGEDEAGASTGMSRGPHAWPARVQEAHATD